MRPCCIWQGGSDVCKQHPGNVWAARLRDQEMVRASLRVDLCVNVVDGIQDKARLAAE